MKLHEITRIVLLSKEEARCRRECREKHRTEPDRVPPEKTRPGDDAVDRFIKGVLGRVGGQYCSPPQPGRCTDCSGLVAEEFYKATGRRITGDSHQQFAACTPVAPADVRPGDVVFHKTSKEVRNGNRDTHVGVIISDTERVDAMNEDQDIIKGPRNSGYWYTTFTRAGRLPWP